MPDPEAPQGPLKTSIQWLTEVKSQLEDMSAAIGKTNRWLEQISKHVTGVQESRLKKLETSAAQAPERDSDAVHPDILKKFNETELLINQSLSEMGRLLNDFEQRVAVMEMRDSK